MHKISKDRFLTLSLIITIIVTLAIACSDLYRIRLIQNIENSYEQNIMYTARMRFFERSFLERKAYNILNVE